jgi:exonuclease VII small subunit
MMSALLFVLLAAAPPTATPTPTPRLNILLSKESEQAAAPTGSLGDVAKRIKLKFPEGQPRVLTNDSVKQLSQGVELTTGRDTGGSAYAAGGTAHESPKKEIWQQRYRDAVNRVADLEAEVKRLEGESARLERDFYAHDDPFQRDGVIKPAWDKAVNDLRQAQADLAEARTKPEEVMEAARRDGALPGWFRGLEGGGPAPAPRGQAHGQPRAAPPTPAPIPPGPS